MRRLMLWVMAGVAIGAVGTSGLSRLRQSDRARQTYERELPDATPIEVGRYTEAQRVHSRLFVGYPCAPGWTVLKEADGVRGKDDMVGLVAGPGAMLRERVETPEEVIGQLTDASDAIVLGVVTGKASQVTADGSFLFTDYRLSVRDVIKTSVGAASASIGSIITVTHPGGKVLVNGVIIKATDRDSLPLPSNGHEMLLFLKFVPETGAYKLTEYRGVFELEGKEVHPLTDQAPDRDIECIDRGC